MKKQLLTAVIFQMMMIAAYAQIPNASFENWTSGNPDGWFTDNSGPIAPIVEDNNAHAGSLAVRGNVVNIIVAPFPPILLLGSNNGEGVHTNTAPEAIHGWYILNSVGSDYFFGVSAIADNNGNATGGGESGHLGPTSIYKEFVINMIYPLNTPNGDSLLLTFGLGNDSAANEHLGSSFVLDDLSFGAPVGIDDASLQSVGFESICPNPSTDESQIIYNLRSSGNTTLNIYDASGRLVKSLVNEMQSPGRYKAIANTDDLPSGIYLCKLSCGEKTDVQKLIVQH